MAIKGHYLGVLELNVLLAAKRQQPNANAATIRAAINTAYGSEEISLGSIYTTLDRLEVKGYVKFAWSEPTPVRGGRSVKYTMLTAKGVDEILKSCRGLKNLGV